MANIFHLSPRAVLSRSSGGKVVVQNLQRITGIFIALLFAFGGLIKASAATLRVRQDGTGNYTTIQAGVNAMAARDTLLIGPGTYPERVTFPSGKSGVAGALTTIKAETPNSVEMYGFDTANCNYLRIESINITVPTAQASNPGIYVRSSNLEIVSNYVHDVLGMGIRATGMPSNNKVIGNHIYNVGMAIFMYGTNWVVEGNDLERLHWYDPLGDADYIVFFGVGHVLKNNYMHGTVESEIGAAHVDGFSSWDNNGEYIYHIRIEGNQMKDFYHQGFIAAAAYYGRSYDVIICNNIFENAASWGALAFNGLKEVKIYNNVFKDIFSNGVGIYGGATGECYNNIFYNVTSWDTGTPRNFGSKNIWYRPGTTLAARFDGDLVNVNPQFVDVANGDFRLKTNSPAINAGVANTNSTVDIEGTPRPQDGAWDIGIYEYESGVVDTRPPTLSAIAAVVVSNNAARVTWNTDEFANSRVDYGLTTSYGQSVTDGGMLAAHQMMLTGLTPGATYHYRVRSVDSAGNTNTSGDFTFAQISTPPTITSQPQGVTNVAGYATTFTVVAAGTPSFAYQWRYNGVNLANGGQFSGATSSTLLITNTQPGNAGDYTVVITNGGGAITSAVAKLAVIQPGACQAAPAGLVGWWTGDGNANNFFGTNNGTLQGGATATAVGLVGQAFTFDGTNSYVQVPDSAILRPTNFTIEGWVRFSGMDSAGSGPGMGNQYIVFKQNPNGSNFEGFALTKARIASGDVFSLTCSSSAGQIASVNGTTLLSPNVWYHVAAMRGPSAMQLYVNGQLEGSANITFPQSYGTLPLYFGTSGQASWDRKFKGTLDEVSLYNRALTQGEITGIFAAGNGGKCKGAVPTYPQFFAPKVQNGLFNFTFTGQVGANYNVLASTNLVNWVQVTNVTLTNGTTTISRPISGNRQFFRAVQVP